MGDVNTDRRALVVLPVPCDARLAFRIMSQTARQWEAEHRRSMSMAHVETRDTEFGRALVIWDKPVEVAQ